MPTIPWPWPDTSGSSSSSGKDFIKQLQAQVNELPPGLFALSAFAAGSTGAVCTYGIYRKYFRRIPNSDWVTPKIMNKRKWIKGRVTSVGDSDNFRLYHTPGFGWRWPLKFRTVPSTPKTLKDKTLHIRIAGADAPEAAHFGRPAQPYSAEALQWMQSRILGRTVYCQLIRRDQYGRLVSVVTVPSRFLPGSLFKGSNLALEMLKSGWATTYEQAGAEYGQWGKEEYLRVEAAAKAAKRGQWAGGLTGETPAEYKRRYAEAEAAEAKETRGSLKKGTGGASSEKVTSGKGWFSWLRRS